MSPGHDGGMSTARRILIPGALIAVPVAFAIGSVALAQVPASPRLPDTPLTVQLATPTPTAVPTPEPTESVAPAPPPPVPAPAPAPVPAPPADDDDDDDGGDDD